jgi:hypothetical protein
MKRHVRLRVSAERFHRHRARAVAAVAPTKTDGLQRLSLRVSAAQLYRHIVLAAASFLRATAPAESSHQ